MSASENSQTDLAAGRVGRVLASVAWLGNAPALLRYAVAFALFLAALIARFALIDVLPPSGFPFLTFFPAVLLAAFLTGLGPGLFASGLSVLAAWFFFLQPERSWFLTPPVLIAVVFFSAILLFDCLVIHWLKAALKRVSFAERLYRRSQAELLEREARLRADDAQKDVFLATLAHELRNPLAPIRTAAELIRLLDPDDESIRRAGVVIERQVLHMSHLVDDLLDISRLTRDTIELRLETLDLRVVVQNAIETIKPLVDGAGLRLDYDAGGPAVTVLGDATRLGQCVTNLLTNAAKFTPRGGRIDLQLSQNDGQASLLVSDNGQGIAPANLERIFELFVQEKFSGLHGHSGLGLGLALTRKLVTLHGGSVVANSAGRDLGSSFQIDLPIALAGAAPASVESSAPDACTEGRLLVIEDNIDAADLLAQFLQLSGFEVSVAYRGEAGLELASRQMPDVVLLDIGLPDMDGYAVCRRIRLLPAGKEPVVIALTGWGTEQDRDRSKQAGFDGHLTKPVDPDALLRQVSELLTARRASEASSGSS
jgi:signal transduction histidine kinase/ActR/RegA family two-component response regulator